MVCCGVLPNGSATSHAQGHAAECGGASEILFELSSGPRSRTGMREPERGSLHDELEVGVSMEQQRVRVDRNSRDQAVDESPLREARLPAHTINGSGLFVDRRAAKRDHMAPEHKSSEHSQMTFIPSARHHLHPLPGVGEATSGSGLGLTGNATGPRGLAQGPVFGFVHPLGTSGPRDELIMSDSFGLSMSFRRPASPSDKQRRRPPNNGT
jgi:hypothetical protein